MAFDGREVERNVQLAVGDLVEVHLTTTPGAVVRTASRIKLLQRGGGLPREQGRVSSMRDNFGFLRSVQSAGDVFFHFSEVPRDGEPPLRVGDEVK